MTDKQVRARYTAEYKLEATPMPQMATRVTELEAKVNQHPRKMGFSWQH